MYAFVRLPVGIMIGAIVTTNGRHGFFMNWFGTQQGEGIEYHLLVIGMCLALIILGSGKYSQKLERDILEVNEYMN